MAAPMSCTHQVLSQSLTNEWFPPPPSIILNDSRVFQGHMTPICLLVAVKLLSITLNGEK